MLVEPISLPKRERERERQRETREYALMISTTSNEVVVKIGSSFPNANRVYVLFFFSSSYNQIVIFLLPSSLSFFGSSSFWSRFPPSPMKKRAFVLIVIAVLLP